MLYLLELDWLGKETFTHDIEDFVEFAMLSTLL